MADTVSSNTLFEGDKRAVYHFTNLLDGTGESAVQKVDISALPGAPSYVKIDYVDFVVSGMSVQVLFDHTADDLALVLQGDGKLCFKDVAGFKDPKSAGGTGDILFTTSGHSSGDSYSITLGISY